MGGGSTTTTTTTTTTSALHLEDQSRTFESQPSGPLNAEDVSLPSKNGVQFNRRRLLIIIAATILIVSVVLIVTLVLLLPASNKSNTSTSNPLLVSTSYGSVMGYSFSWSDGTQLYGWQGIPFAQPPVDNLRWCPPVPPTAWSQTLNCTLIKPKCVQNTGGGLEDCLYLNVYTNAKPSNTGPYPVLFYLHGGGLMGGSTADDQFGGFIAHAGGGNGIVVVQASYRLNIFGFLATTQLSQEQDGVSGNYGIQDQIMALQWVQKNIRNFNGDPTLVTIAGQSSGGTSVFALLSSPSAAGLFSRAISMSGSQNLSTPLSAAQVQNTPIVIAAGCNRSAAQWNDSLTCMRALNVSRLVSLIPNAWNCPGIFGLPKGLGGMHWQALAIVDGRTITHSFSKSLALSNFSDVPIMYGNMGQEPDQDASQNVYNLTLNQWQAYLNKTYEPWNAAYSKNKVPVGQVIGEMYMNDTLSGGPQKAYDAIVSDYALGCAAVTITKGAFPPYGHKKSNIYLFSNNWNLTTSFLDVDDPYGLAIYCTTSSLRQYRVHYAYHSLDLYMVDENWFNVGNGSYIPQSSDLKGSQLLQNYWYQFMMYGNPTQYLNAVNNYVAWKPVNSAMGWPSNHTLMLISRSGGGNKINYRQSFCNYNSYLGISNQSYWWSN